MAAKMAVPTLGLKRFTIHLFLLSFLAIALQQLQPAVAYKVTLPPMDYPDRPMPARFYQPPPEQPKDIIIANAPWSIKLLLLKDEPPRKMKRPDGPRRVGVESLIMRRQEGPPASGPGSAADPSIDEDGEERPQPNERDDDSNMRLKLFRLMYETVRDSDLKVKRAELIRKHYGNSTAFEIGFLMGEVQEKFDVIVEFSGTLRKFYDKWKPIEHINAYEQIANYGIQINHLIDLIRSISKNGSMTY